MKPTDTPTPPQLRLLKGLAAGRELVDVHARFRVGFEDGESFTGATLRACIIRAWVARAWLPGKGGWRNAICITSISDLGREAIKRAETP